MMIVNSSTLLYTFLTKYISSPNQTITRLNFEKIKRSHPIKDSHVFNQNGIYRNYAIILSHLTENDKCMLIRFFQIYLFKVYGIKEKFVSEGCVEWERLGFFVKANDVNMTLFISCFHIFF
jgi:hypothetical protein